MKTLTTSDLEHGSGFHQHHPRDWSRVWSHLEEHYADRIRHRRDVLDAMRHERNGDPYSPFVASAVSGLQTRAAKPWSPSWVYALLADPDITNPVTVSYQAPSVEPGTRERWYAEHPGKRTKRTKRTKVVEPVEPEASDARLNRLLAIIGTSQADFD